MSFYEGHQQGKWRPIELDILIKLISKEYHEDNEDTTIASRINNLNYYLAHNLED